MADTSEVEHTHGDLSELGRRIAGIRFAMVTLPGADGQLHGRPLTVQELEFDGTFWFMVSRSSDWTAGMSDSTPVNVSLSDESSARWVSVSGTALLATDRARVEEMWNKMYEAWFDGVDDPDIALLRVEATTADYWDSDSSRIVRWARIAKAALTGDGADEGERGTLD